MNSPQPSIAGLLATLALGVTACGGYQVPEQYTFVSRGDAEQSSVVYSGQVMRQILSEDLKGHIGGLTARIDGATLTPASGDVVAELDFFFRFDGQTSADVPMGLSSPNGVALLQATYGEISTSANLVSKLAGNDPTGQHKDWSTGFRGWTGASSPEGLIVHWFGQLDAAAVDRANGAIPLDPSGNPISKVHVTAEGLDLQQLIQKFLGVAIAFSQAADDYLDDDIADHGLRVDNTQLVEGKPYTALEHHWDEGFGYFGAARDYGDYTDDELAQKGGRATHQGAFDTDGDGALDLTREFNFGHSLNAAKRDRGSSQAAPTDFSTDAFTAFTRGRALIASAHGPLSDGQMGELLALRDQAIGAWEKAIASTAVHYINEVLADMGRIGTGEYSFLDHAKHWSELKGFALGLQFNPRSPLTDADFSSLHEKLGDAPALAGADLTAYATGLNEAKALLQAAYQFAPENMGDSAGTGGW